MSSDPDDIQRRLLTYSRQNAIELQCLLGAGYDGTVFGTNRKSAIKLLKWRELYVRERDIYLRLSDNQIEEIAGCQVPQLISFDDDLFVLEMTIVTPPYALDFAGAYLDERPDYPADVRRQWECEKRNQFGSHWKYVPRIVVAFEQLGIYLADLNPRNICLDEYQS